MKIRQPEPQYNILAFDDINIGDVLTFPLDKGGFRNGAFMRIYDAKNHNRPNTRISSYTMVRLDNGSAGHTYDLSREMVENKGFNPVLMSADLHLEVAS